MAQKGSNRWLLSYVALGVVWGSSFIFIKLGLEILHPFGVAFGRCLLGSMTLLVIARLKGISLPREPRTWAKLWVVSLLLNVIPGILFAYAEVRVTSVLAGIINAATPLTTLIVIFIAFREERPKTYQFIGLILGGIGVATTLGIWHGLGRSSLLGVFALLVAVSCYGISFPFTKKYVIPLGIQPESLAATQISLGAMTLLPFFLASGFNGKPIHLAPVLGMLGLGALGTGYAYIWNFSIIKIAGSSIASSVTYLTPVVAVFVGWLFLGETVSWNQPIGGLIVIIGAAVSQNRFAKILKR
jgi:drug/metabolite transporter (DMT)-like permease